MRLLFVGDVMLGRLVNDWLESASPTAPWGDTLSVFEAADVRICNLECVVADQGTPWSQTPKTFHFRSDANNVRVLQRAGIDIVSLANNHTLDYGYEALDEMLDLLDEAGIEHAGAGRDIREASRPVIVEHDDLRIGMISFTDNMREWEANRDKPGTFYAPVDPDNWRSQRLLQVVRHVRSLVDILIVAAHWGPNWGYIPQPPHIPFAHALVEAGADIIFGHSCHVFQGVEFYQGKPILYSTGDFVDDYRVDETERNDESFVFVVETRDASITGLKLYPTVIRRFQARRARGDYAASIAQKMADLCADFGTEVTWHSNEGLLAVQAKETAWR